jgi:hypothetical protein
LKSRLYHAGRLEDRDRKRGCQGEDQHPHRAPGIVIGKKGAEIEKLKKEISRLTQPRGLF